MSALEALLWTAATTFAFAWLYTLFAYLRPGAEDDTVSRFGCQLVAYLAALFLVLRKYAPDASIRAFLGVRRTHLAFFPLAVGLGVVLTVPTNLVYDVITKRYPEPDIEQRLVDTFTGASVPMLVLIGFFFVVLGPALEEIFFRGALYQPLRRRYGPALVVAITASLFAVAHIEWQRFASIAMVGASLCLVRWASGSIWPGIVMHASYNALPFWSLVEIARGAPDTDEPVPTGLAVGATAAMIALIVLVIRLGTASRVAREAQQEDLA